MNGLETVLEGIEQWAWIGWIVLIALFLVIEMLTLDFTFLMLSFGSVVGLITDLVGLPFWAQVIIAAAAAAVPLFEARETPCAHAGPAATAANPSATIRMRMEVLLG